MSEGYLLAPSILSADFADLGEAIRQAEEGGADWIHVDVMDGHYVPNLTFGPVIVEACRRVTDLPLDVHLMVERPNTFVQAFAEAGANSLTVHPEAEPHLHRTLEAIRDLGLLAGVALNPGTPAIAVHEILHMVDLVMVMTVNPGYSGQAFIPSALEKMRTIHGWIQERKLEIKIEADGGITAETAPLAAEAGAEIFVAATSVFHHPEGIKAGLEALRRSLQRE
ncbi:MAG: ribulose-phosphate 3-epimerase [Anaerolineales bacterium]